MPVPLSEGGGQPSVKSLRGGSIARFWPQGGSIARFRREAPENGAEGAVLENFERFFEKLLLKMQYPQPSLTFYCKLILALPICLRPCWILFCSIECYRAPKSSFWRYKLYHGYFWGTYPIQGGFPSTRGRGKKLEKGVFFVAPKEPQKILSLFSKSENFWPIFLKSLGNLLTKMQ